MNIRKILGTDPLTPRRLAPIPEKGSEVRLLRFDSFSFQPDTDFKISFHNQPIPVTPHRHDYYEASYVYRGSFLHQTEEGETVLGVGDLFVVPPDKVHSVTECSPDCQGINFLIRDGYFTSSVLPLLTPEAGKCAENFAHFACFNSPQIRTVVDSLLEEQFFPERQSKPFITCYLVLLFNNCGRISGLGSLKTEESKKLQKRVLAAKMMKYIAFHHQKVSLPLLSREFGYSQNYISRLIREESGYSFCEYKLNIQLEEATRLLMETDLSIHHAAELAGFSNASFFYRKFKEKYGTTPAEYFKKG